MAKLLQMSLLFEALLDDEQTQTEVQGGLQSYAAPPLNLPYTDAGSNLDPEHHVEVADALQREAALAIQQSCIVEAPAGSGKTGLLIQRFLKLLAFGEVEHPDEVLAITFTRKAEAEMRHRVLAQLVAAHSATVSSSNLSPFQKRSRELAEAALARDRALGWNLLQNPKQLNIRTIDSFCAELAGSTPLIAGAAGRYSPTDDPAPLYRAAAERTLMHMGGKDEVLTADLECLVLHRDAQPEDFVRLLADMLRQREQWGELLPLDAAQLTEQALDQEIRPRLTRTLQRLVSEELEMTAKLIGEDLLHRLASLAHTLSTCPGYNEEASPIAQCRELPSAPAASAADLDHWVCLSKLLLKGDGSWRSGLNRKQLGFEASRTEQQEIRHLIDSFQERERSHPGVRKALQQLEELPSPEYPEDQWHVVKALCRVLRHALVELQLVFAEQHSCDFSEIALTARGLIRSGAEISDGLSTATPRIQHLLVDEMQDTSAGQYELLETLTSSWDGTTQTLFLVGDPKQSIYEFRQARVERFRRVMEEKRFGHLSVIPLRLTANFRSQGALVSDFNNTFSSIFPSPEDPSLTTQSVDVPFIEASVTRPSTCSPALVWHIDEKTDPGPSDLAVDSESEQLAIEPTPAAHARAIREIVEQFANTWASSRPPRIAVLGRNRLHLAPIVQEFHQDRGHGPLSFRAVDVEALSERPEILDLLSLTRALLSPADRVAWLAVLRSPVCGLSLADLLALTGDGPEAEPNATIPRLMRSRTSHLTLEGQQLVMRVQPILEQALRDLGRTPISTHIERTWRSLGGDAPLKPHERANARRFLNLLHECAQGPEGLTPTVLNRRLKGLYAQPSTPDALVELMTIHKAKGLEWDLVVVPALHRGSGRNDPAFLRWLEFDSNEGHPEFLLAPIQSKGEKASSLSTWLTRRQQQRETAEAKRLFYVACTRAREELHLFGTISRRRSGSLSTPRPDSLLAAAWPAVEPSIGGQGTPGLSSSPFAQTLKNVGSFPTTAELSSGLSLAASAEQEADNGSSSAVTRSQLRRLPVSFDPLGRFSSSLEPLLPYPDVANLPTTANYVRPDGSFLVRAFGNAVHRFLELIARLLEAGHSLQELRDELPGWKTRLYALLRSEGLAPAQANTEAVRALGTLEGTLRDPDGLWLLSPHTRSRSEVRLTPTGDSKFVALRADRMFLAGDKPHTQEDASHLWIVDFKTAELGGRKLEEFLAEQKRKYRPQMETYAAASVSAGTSPDNIILALYFPVVSALVYWPFLDK